MKHISTITLVVFSALLGSSVLNSRNAQPMTMLYHSAYNYMENEGFEMVTVHGEIDRDGSTYIVVTASLNQFAIEKPILSGFQTFSKGMYWAKPKIFGGLESIITHDGEELEFTFSDVIDL
jgi:hypothetical protein